VAFTAALVAAASTSTVGAGAAIDVDVAREAEDDAAIARQLFSLSMIGDSSAKENYNAVAAENAAADDENAAAADDDADNDATDTEAALDDESLARWTGMAFASEAAENRGMPPAFDNGNPVVQDDTTPSASMITERVAAAVAAANQSSTITTEWRPTPIKGDCGGGGGSENTISALTPSSSFPSSPSALAAWHQPSASTPVSSGPTPQAVGSSFVAGANNAGVSLGSIKLSWGDSPAAASAPAPAPPRSTPRRSGRILPSHPSSTKQKRMNVPQSPLAKGSARRPFATIQQSMLRSENIKSASKMNATAAAAAERADPRTSVVFESTPFSQCTNLGCSAKFDPFDPVGCTHHASAVDWRASTGYYWPCCQSNSTTYLSYTAASRSRGCVEGNHAESTSLLAKSMTASRAPPTGSKAGTLGARIKIRLSENMAAMM